MMSLCYRSCWYIKIIITGQFHNVHITITIGTLSDKLHVSTEAFEKKISEITNLEQ